MVQDTTSEISDRENINFEELRLSGNQTYANYEATLKAYMITQRKKHDPDHIEEEEPPRLQESGAPLHNLWTEYLGYAWQIPPDGRVSLTFCERSLINDDKYRRLPTLERLRRWGTEIGPGCFNICDYDINNSPVVYTLPSKADVSATRADYQVPLHKRIMEGEKKGEEYDFSSCYLEPTETGNIEPPEGR